MEHTHTHTHARRTHTHTRTHTCVYIYIYIYWLWVWLSLFLHQSIIPWGGIHRFRKTTNHQIIWIIDWLQEDKSHMGENFTALYGNEKPPSGNSKKKSGKHPVYRWYSQWKHPFSSSWLLQGRKCSHAERWLHAFPCPNEMLASEPTLVTRRTLK